MTQIVLTLNITKSTLLPITLIRINYIASTEHFDIRTHYQDYNNQ